MERWPNLFLMGVPRGGTTFLAQALAAHPQIFVPNTKEPRFFHYRGVEPNFENPVLSKQISYREAAYLRLYEHAKQPFLLDATPTYFRDEAALSAIAAQNSQALFICLLRDPVERAFAHFLYAQKQGFESLETTFETAISQLHVAYPNQFKRQRYYLQTGLYATHLAFFLKMFNRNQLFICSSERFFKEQGLVWEELLTFLNINYYQPQWQDMTHAKSGILPKGVGSAFLRALFNMRHLLPKSNLRASFGKIWKRNYEAQLQKPPMQPETRTWLINYYRQEVETLKRLTGQSFSEWSNFT